MKKYFMSIDLGTSSVRAFIADFECRAYHSVGKSYDVFIPQIGYAEQDPQMWYDSTVSVIRELLAQANVNPDQVAAISFSGQMHGLVALDERCQPVMNAAIWMDQRSGEVLDEIYGILGREQIQKNTQNRIAAGYMVGTLYWLKTRRRNLYDRIRHVMMPKDYVKFRLSGAITTDYSDAAGSLAFDNRRLCWAEPMLEKLGLDVGLFPECGLSTRVVGHITPQAARETGLSERTLVVNGGGDSFMQAIGNGITREGVFASNIGTGGQISTTVRKLVFDHDLRTCTFAHVLPGCWQLSGACLNSGISLKWISRQVLGRESYEAVNREVEAVQPGARGLFFLPYLTGERTPHMDPKARSIFLGLTLDHGAADMERAVMEGVVFALRNCLDLLLEMGTKCDRIIAAGGGVRSDVWLQIQSDIFERDVYRSASKEQACLGAAMTAAVGAGAFMDFEEACDACVDAPVTVFRPKSENVKIYQKAYPIFNDIYRQNQALFVRIADTQQTV